MKLIEWQYSPKWHLSYYKYQNNWQDHVWWEYIICVGPFQFRFGGKLC